MVGQRNPLKMLIRYGTKVKAAHLGTAMIEIAAVVDHGNVLQKHVTL